MIKHKFFPHHAVNLLILAVMIFAVAPLFYFGQDSILTIHDLLDSSIAWLKMLKDNGQLLALDSPTNVLGNMSSTYFAISYNILLLPYLFFDVYTAHILGYVIKIVVGYCSMLLLLRHLFPNPESSSIIKLVSLCFAVLPSQLAFWLSMETIPLICYFFLIIMKWQPAQIDKRIFLLVFFPLFSNFPIAGFFVLGLWLVATIMVSLQKKKIHWNLVLGLLLLIVGYVLVDAKMFYAKFVLQEALNRSLVSQFGTSFMVAMESLPAEFTFGGYHAPLLATRVVFPTVFLTLLLVVIFICYKNITDAYDTKYNALAKYALWSIALLALCLLFAFFGAVHGYRHADAVVAAIFPFLKGFNWGRISFFNRTIIYVVFAMSLVMLTYFKKIRYVPYGIVILQILFILTYRGYYSYTGNNLAHSKMIKKDEVLTYNEFYSEDLFREIKADLQYKDEGVAALGYHPSVLMYNGFSTVDGYNNAYPLKYALAFREIIAPQLELNKEHKKYYDSWAGRLYLYNDDMSYDPARKRVETPVTLHINVDAFRRLGGMYILSRAEIGNAGDLGLHFIRKYSNSRSIYEIFVYKAS